MEHLIEQFGEPALMLVSGALVGLLFGAAAYRSRFCLRAATAELAQAQLGPKMAIWLVAFLSALTGVQAALAMGWLDVSEARQLAATGSMSGAIIGGVLFGIGMTMARGCASRLLVLSASGNLRAIITGLVLTLTAQAALTGALAPLREVLAGLWTVPGGETRRLFSEASVVSQAVTVAAPIALIAAWAFGRRHAVGLIQLVSAALVGLAVCAGWLATYAIANASFDVIAVQSVTFTGPSTDTLMALINERDINLSFGQGLVLGVFSGALIAAVLMGEARIQRFEPGVPMERYLLGGVFMGFGSMLAGGCAVGAGMSGGAILSSTAWIAVACMWIGAVGTQVALLARPQRQAV